MEKKKGHIPVDGRSYLTYEGGGHYMLWDQQNYTASSPVAQIDEPMASEIMHAKEEGKT